MNNRRLVTLLMLAGFNLLLFSGCSTEKGQINASRPQAHNQTSSRPLIGAIRWDAWHKPRKSSEHGSEGGPVVSMMKSLGPEQYQHRLPFFAKTISTNEVRIDGYTQKIVDQEISFAKAGGIDYWAFLLYDEGNSMSDGLDLYLSSKRKRDVNFCAITSPGTFGNAQQFGERMKRVVRLIEEPSYQMVMNDRPLLYLFNVSDEWLKAWGSESNARILFDKLRAAVRTSGRGDPYIVVMDFNPEHGKKIASIIGANALSTYATGGRMKGETAYIELSHRASEFWEKCRATGMETVPIVMAGWDRRPRIAHPVPWEKYQKPGAGINDFYKMPTPAELAQHIRDAMQWTIQHKGQSPAQAVIVYAWNEHDEGGFLCPTLNKDGSANDSRLRAIRAMLKSFKPALNTH